MPSCGRLREFEEPLRNGRAVRARVELCGEIAERHVQLRREDEHGQRGLEADSALGEPHADHDGDERDAQGRRELEDRSRQERRAKRLHRRPAVLLADLGDARRLRARAVERPQRRQPAHDVEEMVGEQRQRLPALACAPLRIAADEPHEHGDEREREEHHACREEIDRRDEREDGDRHDDRQDDLREVARERRLERVHARHGGGRHLRALGAVERGRPAAKPRLDDVEPELGDHVAGCAPADDLEAPRAERARNDDPDEQHERRRDLAERRALESHARPHAPAAPPGRARATPSTTPSTASATSSERTARARRKRRGSRTRIRRLRSRRRLVRLATGVDPAAAGQANTTQEHTVDAVVTAGRCLPR